MGEKTRNDCRRSFVVEKGDTYYLIYSANHYESKDYAVGYATASSPKGPWTKYSGNPILRRDKEAAKSVGLVGTGHGAPLSVQMEVINISFMLMQVRLV